MKRFATLTLLGIAATLSVGATDSPAVELQAKTRSLGGSFKPLDGPQTLMSRAKVASKTVTTIENGDGTYEGVWGLVDQDGVDQSEWVQRFTLPAQSGEVTDAAICFSSDFGGSFDFEFLVFEANGNRPGPELMRVGFRTPTLDPIVVECLTLPALNFATSTSRYFFGVQFSAKDDLLVLADENSPEQEPSFVRATGVTGFERMGGSTSIPSFEPFRNLALAVNFDDGGGGQTGNTDPCVANSSTMCLNGDRFEVTTSFATSQGTSGTAQVVELTNDSGYVWFFDEDNVEGVFKLLDGCAVNGNYWFFAGGLTDVSVTIGVRDSETGFEKIYRNPLGTPFQPIQDTGAFATCP